MESPFLAMVFSILVSNACTSPAVGLYLMLHSPFDWQHQMTWHLHIAYYRYTLKKPHVSSLGLPAMIIHHASMQALLRKKNAAGSHHIIPEVPCTQPNLVKH